MQRDNPSEEYEKSEEIAIQAGKAALSKSPWLFNRAAGKRGFFVELRENKEVHPDYYSVHCVDGVGTKLFLAPWSNDFVSPSIDGVMMNSNDMATIMHALPDTVNIYLAVQRGVEEQHMGEIMEGIRQGLERIRVTFPFNVNIGKLETASLDEMIGLGVQNKGYDIGIALNGFIRKNRVPNLDPKPGQVILGLPSTGLHSNGYTGARHVLLTPDVEYRDEFKPQYRGRFSLNDRPDVLEGMTVLEALQIPTASYFLSSFFIAQEFRNNRDIYGVNITGNGLHNFNRAGAQVSFEITDPLPLLPIHKLLIQESKWDAETSYKKQNNGMGFAYIGDRDVMEASQKVLEKRGIKSEIVGEVRASDSKELVTRLHKPYEGKGPLEFRGYSS